MIFITVLGIMVVLSGLILVFAQNMRTEAIASANRRSYLQADAIEQGAERWVLAQTEANQGDALTITQTPAEALQVGQGYFWILRPNQETNQDFDFGIADECGKLNLNTASSDELINLPDMTQEIADAIVDWRSDGSQPTGDGAESDYYNSLPEPYNCKNSPLETVEESLLIKGVTPQLLFGYDLNRNGVIDDNEQKLGGVSSSSAGVEDDSRGIFPDVTVYSVGGAGTPAGLVNVNTASEEVLLCLPGITQSDADALIAARSGNVDSTNIGWALSVLGADAAGVAPLITATSNHYSADIVAVSPDGRGFKRVLIVVDATQIPAKIVYRKDLTSLGWPLDPAIRQQLRSGQPIVASSLTMTK